MLSSHGGFGGGSVFSQGSHVGFGGGGHSTTAGGGGGSGGGGDGDGGGGHSITDGGGGGGGRGWHGFSHSEHIVHGTSNWSFATTVEVAKDGVGTSRIMVDSVNNSGKLAMFVGVVKIVLFPAERYVEGIKELYMRERNIVRENMRGFWL